MKMIDMVGKKVYIVTDGDYSDYHIRAVFSKKEIAEAYAKKFHYDNVVDRDVDEWNCSDTRKIFSVIIDKTGNVSQILEMESSHWWHKASKEQYNFIDGRMFIDVLAFDKQHAIKIVNEKRLQLIARGEWK